MKIEIELTEEAYKNLKEIEGDLLPRTVRTQAIAAYEKQQNKIQVGDWVRFADVDPEDIQIWQWTGKERQGVARCIKLSQPLQDMLNKEINP